MRAGDYLAFARALIAKRLPPLDFAASPYGDVIAFPPDFRPVRAIGGGASEQSNRRADVISRTFVADRTHDGDQG